MDMYQKREQRKNKVQQEGTQEVFTKTNINWYPGHMAKTKRELAEKLDQIDVVYELIDARIPYASKLRGMETLIKNKLRILIMTKYDLCDPLETKKWISYYEKQGYTVIVIDVRQGQALKELFRLTKAKMKETEEAWIKKGLKVRRTRVLCLGVPNVGKSTLINRVAGRKAANVGNKPGITKQLNWIRVTDGLELMDSPGLLWPKLEEGNVALSLSAMGTIKEEILPLEEVAFYILNCLFTYYPALLESRYGLTTLDLEREEIFMQIAKKRGCLRKGNQIDEERVIELILNDIKEERIKGITFDRVSDYESK